MSLEIKRVVAGGDDRARPGTRVDPDSGTAGLGVVADAAGVGEEVGEGVLGVDPALDGVAPQGDLVLREAQRLAFGHPDHGVHQVQAADQLGDRVLHLQPGVHLQEEEPGALGALLEKELNGAGRRVADLFGEADGGLAHRLAGLGVEHRRGRLFQQLLVAPLQRAVALAQVDHVAVFVGEDLDLDVPGVLQVTLHVDLGAAERKFRLPGCARRTRPCASLFAAHHPKAAAAAPFGRLQRHRPAVFGGEGTDGLRSGDRALRTRDAGDIGLGSDPAGGELVAGGLDRLRRGADPGQSGVDDRLGEAGVFGEEPVPGVDGVGPRLARRLRGSWGCSGSWPTGRCRPAGRPRRRT